MPLKGPLNLTIWVGAEMERMMPRPDSMFRPPRAMTPRCTIRKSVQRFSEKIMLNQRPRARWRFNLISSRSGRYRRHSLSGHDGVIPRMGIEDILVALRRAP